MHFTFESAGVNIINEASPLLALAIYNDDLAMVKCLIQYGADCKKRPLLKIAVEAGNTEIVRTLIKAGADINQQDEFILDKPVKRGQLAMIKCLIDLGMDVNCYDVSLKTTLLQYADYHRQYEIKKLLIAHGAVSIIKKISSYADSYISESSDSDSDNEFLIDSKTFPKKPKLHQLIVDNKKKDIINLLATNQENFNVITRVAGMTPLIRAIRCERPRIVELLIKAGVNLDYVDFMHRTPLIWAVKRGRIKLVQMLLKAGADPLISDHYSMTASDYAEKYRHPSIQLLLNQKIKLKALVDEQQYVSINKLYEFNPHCHVKIWLSKDENVFMNEENKFRLVQMRASCSDDDIYLVYDSLLLTSHAQNELKNFCSQPYINIIFTDLRTDIFPLCTKELEKILIAIYQDEVTHLNEGGNLASASDIIRWLSPIYRLGVYSDFDLLINTSALNKTILVKSPMLLNMGSKVTENGIILTLCNDIIAVIDLTSPYIERVQISIIEANQPSEKKPIDIPGVITVLSNVTCTPREYRHYIFCVQKELKSIILNRLDKKNSSSAKVNLLDFFLSKLSLLQHDYLQNVVHATGPYPLRMVLTSNQTEITQKSLMDIAPLAFSSNLELFCAFVSGQGGALHIHRAATDKLRSMSRINDLSWLPSGAELIEQREKVLHEKAAVIQACYKGFFSRTMYFKQKAMKRSSFVLDNAVI